MNGHEYLLDVSRLIWRFWSGRLPTGIDRVCLAYLEYFGDGAQAVVQRKGKFLVLSRVHSKRLFNILTRWRTSKPALAGRLAAARPSARRSPPRSGMLYFNVGHTGLEDPALPQWIESYGLKAVYLIHDLIPLTHPEYCRPGEDTKHARRMDHVLASASGVVANSRATLDALSHYAHSRGSALPPNLVALIAGYEHNGIVQPRRDDRPYFVTVGTIEGRKNHILLLQIWQRLTAELKERTPTLVIIGQRGWEADAAIALLDQGGQLQDHVRELGTCDDHQLASWMAGARALLMPSFVEGFGLPVIEALQLGTPVIATDLPVYREIAGDIPRYLEPSDGQAWEQAIRAFANDAPERNRQLALIEGYRAPDWPSHFRQVEEWLPHIRGRTG